MHRDRAQAAVDKAAARIRAAHGAAIPVRAEVLPGLPKVEGGIVWQLHCRSWTNQSRCLAGL